MVSSEKIKDFTLEQIKNSAQLFGLGQYSDRSRHAVNAHRFVYYTDYKGKKVKSSGLLLIPVGSEKSPFVSVHHGTVFGNNDVPSAAAYAYAEYVLLSSFGYIVLMPDYLGYQESKDVFHPYYDRKMSASVVTDMAAGAKEYLDKEKLSYKNEIYLTGYSEGGYVTLCALEKFEKDDHFKVKGTFAGAGGYDLLGVLKNALAEKKEYPAPAYLVFILSAYNQTYGWNRKASDFFSDKVAKNISNYFNGKNSFSSVNSELPTRLTELFSTEFYNALKDSTKELTLKKALAENSVSYIKPESPLFLYHGNQDDIVPYATSEITYKNLKSAGVKDVEFKTIPGGDHGTTYFPMLVDFVKWLEKVEGR